MAIYDFRLKLGDLFELRGLASRCTRPPSLEAELRCIDEFAHLIPDLGSLVKLAGGEVARMLVGNAFLQDKGRVYTPMRWERPPAKTGRRHLL